MLLNKVLRVFPPRILSALADHVILVALAMIVSVGEELVSPNDEGNKSGLNAAILLISIFVNKDIYFGQSAGKYFNGFRVVSSGSGNPAGPIQCAIRNFFLLAWPIEGLILFFSPQKRIGDIVAGTKVQKSSEIGYQNKWKYPQAIISLTASFTLIYYLFTFIDDLQIMT